MNNSIKIILVDDHRIFREGLRRLIEDFNNMEVIGETAEKKELRSILEKTRPDVILMDISLPEISGIDLTRWVKADFPEVRVVMLSMHTNEEFVMNAIQAGANGFLPKEISREELRKAIISVNNGRDFFEMTIADNVFRKFVEEKRSGSGNDKSHIKLTRREMEILKLIVDGLDNKQIASKLFISIRTVNSHKYHIMKKTNAGTAAGLIRYAIKNKLFS